jgi:hypothetical protein
MEQALLNKETMDEKLDALTARLDRQEIAIKHLAEFPREPKLTLFEVNSILKGE